MPPKVKAEEMEKAIKKYLKGEGYATGIAAQLGIDRRTFQRWTKRYRTNGSAGLKYEPGKRYIEKNPIYPAEVKEAAVLAYRAGEGSQADICKKFGIRSTYALQNWIKVYNSGKDFRACLKSRHVRIVRQIFRQTRRFDAGILCVFQGKSTQYGGKDGVQAVRAEILNRLLDTRCQEKAA